MTRALCLAAFVALVGCGRGTSGQKLARDLPLETLGALVVRNGALYFGTEERGVHSLARLDLATGGVETLADRVPGVRALVVDERFAYWTDGASLDVLALAGGAPRVMDTAQQGYFIAGLGPSGRDRLFWIEAGNVFFAAQIARGDPADPQVANADIASFTGWADGFATDPNHLYWVDAQGIYVRNNLDGTHQPIVTLAMPVLGYPSGLIVDETQLYWYEMGKDDPNQGALAAVPLVGGPSTTLARPNGLVFALAVDEDYLYWREASCILRVPKHGGTVEVVADGLQENFDLAVSAGSLFWSQRGSIYRLRKSRIQAEPSSYDCLTTRD